MFLVIIETLNAYIIHEYIFELKFFAFEDEMKLS